MVDDVEDRRGPDEGRAAVPDGSEGPSQGTLPLDLDPDEPVPFRLTPKARRLVAPDQVPTLEVVGEDHATDPVPEDLDDPHDPRSARARALRRGGMSVADIADRLHVDELAVRSWVGDLTGSRRRHRLRAVTPPRRPTPPTHDAQARLARRRATYRQERERAVVDGPRKLADPTFVRGLAFTVAAAEIDEHAVLVAVRDRDVATVVCRWLVAHAGADPRELRVVLRLGSAVGADLAVHRWAEALSLPLDRISRTVWRSAPADDAVEAMVRVPDVAVAARVAGWRDVLLAGPGPRDLPQVGG